MGEGTNISGGVRFQAPIQETNTVDEGKPKEIKEEAPSAAPPKEPPRSDVSSRKVEQSLNGVVFKNDLNKQLDKKALYSESLKSADKILMNPRLSNEAKIAELQKMIGKTDKAEFQTFMKTYSNLPDDQKQLINSAITESEKIMGRIGSELPQSEQLKVVQEATANPLKGKTPKEEEKRLQRFDKGVAEWMQTTDGDTLNKALDGTSVDMRTSARLYGTLVSDTARLIVGMGMHKGKLMGDQLEIATQLMNIAINPQRSFTRDDIETAAGGLMMEKAQNQVRQGRLGRSSERE